MSKLIVYSCVTGNYDSISKTLLASIGAAESDVSYVLFTDRVKKPEKVITTGSNISWEFRPLLWRHKFCNRRTARWHKINSHLVFPGATCTVWIDGSQRIKNIKLKEKLISSISTEAAIATFKHPDRSCIYQELDACIARNKDNPLLMRKQVEAYRKEGYPPFNGLVETACVFRRNCTAASNFNDAWWQQILKYSFRDQLSFNYTAWKLKQDYAIIPGRRDSSPFFEFIPHRHK